MVMDVVDELLTLSMTTMTSGIQKRDPVHRRQALRRVARRDVRKRSHGGRAEIPAGSSPFGAFEVRQ